MKKILEQEKKYANKAMAMSGGKSSLELMSVYARIKQYYREEGLVDDNEYIEKVYFSKKQSEIKIESDEMESEELGQEVVKGIPDEEESEKIVSCDIQATIGDEKHMFHVRCEVKQLLDFLGSVGTNNWTVLEEKEGRTENKDNESNGKYELLEKLKKLRLEIAKEEGIPAYCVFRNSTLTDMAELLPQTYEDMLRINGVGPNNYVKYGVRFKQAICDYLTGI